MNLDKGTRVRIRDEAEENYPDHSDVRGEILGAFADTDMRALVTVRFGEGLGTLDLDIRDIEETTLGKGARVRVLDEIEVTNGDPWAVSTLRPGTVGVVAYHAAGGASALVDFGDDIGQLDMDLCDIEEEER